MVNTCDLLHSARMTLQNCTTNWFQKSTTQKAGLCLSSTTFKLRKYEYLYIKIFHLLWTIWATADARKSYLLKNPVRTEIPELSEAACVAWKGWQWLRAGGPKQGLIHGSCYAPRLCSNTHHSTPLLRPQPFTCTSGK